MDARGSESQKSRFLDLVSIGTEFGKLVFESGKRELAEWSNEMLQLDEAFRPLLKDIHTLLIRAEQSAGAEAHSPLREASTEPNDGPTNTNGPDAPRSGEGSSDAGPGTLEVNTPIQQMLDNKQITVRAFNVCRNAGLMTIGDIQHYYAVHGTFQDLRSCGVTTNDLLRRIAMKNAAACKSEPNATVPVDPVPHSDPGELARTFKKAYGNLSPEAREYLQRVIPNLKADLVYAYLIGLGRHIPANDTNGQRVATELRHLRRQLIAANKMDRPHREPHRSATKRNRPKELRQPDLAGIGERLVEVLREHQHPLHIQSIARKLALADQASKNALSEAVLSGKLDPAVHVGDGFIGLYWRTYKTLPPPPKQLHDSLYRRAIWAYFTGYPIKELHTYLLGCSDLGEGFLISAIYRKMNEKGYYLDTQARLRAGNVEG